MADIAKFLDKAHEQKEFAEFVNAPAGALAGVSATDAETLASALGIRTVWRPGHQQVRPLGPAVAALSK